MGSGEGGGRGGGGGRRQRRGTHARGVTEPDSDPTNPTYTHTRGSCSGRQPQVVLGGLLV